MLKLARGIVQSLAKGRRAEPRGTGEVWLGAGDLCELAAHSERLSSAIDQELTRLRQHLGATDSIAASLGRLSPELRGSTWARFVAPLDGRATLIERRLGDLENGSWSPGVGVAPAPMEVAPSHLLGPQADQALAEAARDVINALGVTTASQRATLEKTERDMMATDRVLRSCALESFARLGAAAVPVLRVAARHPDEELRFAAIRAAIELQPPAMTDLLAAGLRDPSCRVRTSAVWALFRSSPPSLMAHLCEALDDPEPRVRRIAASCLGRMKDSGAEGSLKARLADESSEVRAAVAEALGHCGTESSVFRLIGLLGDEDPQTRDAARVALGRLILAPLPDVTRPAAGAVRELRSWWRQERLHALGAELGLIAGEPESRKARHQQPFPNDEVDRGDTDRG